MKADADAAQRAFEVAVRRYGRRRQLGWTLLVLGAVVAATHLLSHAEAVDLRMSAGWQDLLIGYPTAALFVIIAAVSLGQIHPAERGHR